MKPAIVVVGMGEIGSVFARGWLRCGHPVYPVTRSMQMQDVAAVLPNPALVLIAVGEADLHNILAAIPMYWRDRIALLQNELLPRDWQQHGLHDPTVVSVWFEKKKGQDVKIVVPSPIYGTHAELLQASLQALDIPCYLVHDQQQLLFELVRKNYYILVSNIAGLETGGNVSDLWTQHNALAQAVAQDVHRLQEYLTAQALPHTELLQAMLVAFQGDPTHQCMGRSAPARLQRALQLADRAGLAVPTLRKIAANRLNS